MPTQAKKTQGRPKKVAPGTALANQIQAHISGGFTLMVYFYLTIVLMKDKIVAIVISFQSGKILSEYLKPLCSVLASDNSLNA